MTVSKVIIMNLFVTGQLTLHQGRLEFGNIGNYYVVEPIFRELRIVFPEAEIRTTFQFSSSFLQKYDIKTLPMQAYWDFESDENLPIAEEELRKAYKIRSGDRAEELTTYIEAVLWCDAFIDISGDIWGDNADFIGKDRFRVGLLKDQIAQILGKPTFMLAGSPGPFSDKQTCAIAHDVYKAFTYVTNREPLSTALLVKQGFSCGNTLDLACPSFLFRPCSPDLSERALIEAGLRRDDRPIIGFILCGWNFEEGPFDKSPRRDEEYRVFVNAAEYMIRSYDAKICLVSHSNGFIRSEDSIKLIHGRDYVIIKQLERILRERGMEVYSLDNIYTPEVTKGIIGKFNMLVSGRLHGAVAGLSQGVPTVTIDYGHEPKAHKSRGFNLLMGSERFLADPTVDGDLEEKIRECWKNRTAVRRELLERLPAVEEMARKNFTLVKDYFDDGKKGTRVL